MNKKYDFLIAGSGFGGTVMAMCLAQSGFDVCLVERGSHPRFAIGESSTPIADMILRDLADQYNLPFLKEISRYGEWQRHHPDVVCGLKRGFSYYMQVSGKKFDSDKSHKNELLVAASTDDENSDTNWLRSDVDSFLVSKAGDAGVQYFEMTEVTEIWRDHNLWKVELIKKKRSKKLKIEAKWIIDATGSPIFSGKFFNTISRATGFHTDSSAIYSHFEGAGRWSEYLKENGFYMDDYPYSPDHSALHQIIEEGWIWMLRFNNNLLSAGVVMDNHDLSLSMSNKPETIWNQVISKYPSVKQLFNDSNPAKMPGSYIQTGRLQRRLNKMYGEGWVALNHTGGFVDPLHSTGIAHTMSGVEKLAALFSNTIENERLYSGLENIERQFFSEIELIDLLVSSFYLTRNRFELLSASVMLYFAASITYEQSRLKGIVPDTYLCSGEPGIKSMVKKFHDKFNSFRRYGYKSSRENEQLIEEIRESIKPFNTAGLMDDEKRNMYTHTAVLL